MSNEGHIQLEAVTFLDGGNPGSFCVGDTISFELSSTYDFRKNAMQARGRGQGVVCALWQDPHPNIEGDRGYYAEVVTATGSELRVFLVRDRAMVEKVGAKSPAPADHEVYGDTGRRMRFGNLFGMTIASHPAEFLTGSGYRDVDVFRKVDEIRRELADVEQAYVDTMRAEGASWADVGAAVGASRQAAQQRFGGK